MFVPNLGDDVWKDANTVWQKLLPVDRNHHQTRLIMIQELEEYTKRLLVLEEKKKEQEKWEELRQLPPKEEI